MLILAIETSCDETACAIVKVSGSASNPKFKTLSSVVSSQVEIHAPFGGVVPTLASREHLKNLPAVFKKTVRAAKIKIENIDYIAVTQGPGLVIALLIGVQFARGLAYAYGKKIIPVHHIAGHIYSNWLTSKKIKFPLLNIVVSGGHTELILMKKIGDYEMLGSTRDDAAGEAFDKAAKMLGLGYPGGPIISKLAEKGNPNAYPFPRPMMHSKNYDFSFAGLKTAALYTLQDNPKIKKNKKQLADFCASFQQAVVDVIIAKTIKATKNYNAKIVALSGGVSANTQLREQLEKSVKKEFKNVGFLMPSMELTGDNAIMIAAAACFNRKKVTSWKNLDADTNLKLD